MGNVIEVTGLTGRIAIRSSIERNGKRFVVSEYVKLATFKEMLIMLDSNNTGSSSLSNVLYRVSAGVVFLEKNEMGCHVPLMCSRTAPTAVSEASVMRQVGASG